MFFFFICKAVTSSATAKCFQPASPAITLCTYPGSAALLSTCISRSTTESHQPYILVLGLVFSTHSAPDHRILLSLLEEFDPVTYKQSQQLSSPCADHGRQLNLTSPAVDSAPSTFRPPKLNSLKTEKRRGHFLTTPSHHSPIRTALLIHMCTTQALNVVLLLWIIPVWY